MIPCPYEDDGVVYSVTLSNNGYVMGQFAKMAVPRPPFWTITNTEQGGAGDWIDVNPYHIISIQAADGLAYAQYREVFPEAA